MAIVYQHRRKDNNEIFYIGIGLTDKRAYHTKSRGKFWKDYTSKYQYEVEITHRNIIWEEACVIEKYLISFYGRRDLGLGSLVNMTDGGDGVIGRKDTLEQRKKKKERVKGKNNPYCKLEVIHKIRLKKIGKQRHDMIGENNIIHRSDVKEKSKISFKKFINSEKGILYREELSKRFSGENNPSKIPAISQKIKNSLIKKFSILNKEEKIKLTSYMNNKKLMCEYCGKETNSGNYKRWHSSNCKNKK